MPRAGPVRSLLLVPPAQQDEGRMNKPTSPGSCGHCQGKGKVREAKRWIFEEFQAKNQTGKNQSFCLRALGSDRTLAQNSLHVQNERKPEKTNFKSQKENCKGTLHKPKIPLLSTAALLQCRKNREVFVPFALPQLSPAQEGEPGKGSKLCAVSPPHLLRPPRLHS